MQSQTLGFENESEKHILEANDGGQKLHIARQAIQELKQTLSWNGWRHRCCKSQDSQGPLPGPRLSSLAAATVVPATLASRRRSRRQALNMGEAVGELIR